MFQIIFLKNHEKIESKVKLYEDKLCDIKDNDSYKYSSNKEKLVIIVIVPKKI